MITRRAESLYLLPLHAAIVLLLLAGGCATKAPVQEQKPHAFWPTFPDEPRLQFLASFNASTDIAPAKSKIDQLIYGKEPEQTLPVNKPYGVAMWNGRIYLCDLRAGAVTILDLRKRQTLVMGISGLVTLSRPTDIAIAPDGTKYVADIGRGQVFVFDAQDRYVGNFGRSGLKPVGVAVYQDELFVCDFEGQKIDVLNRRTGESLRTIGEPGSEPGQFFRPLGIDVDAEGNIYVSDALACRLQKFDREGKLLMHFGTISNRAGGMVRPKHIAVDRDGIIYIVDAAFQNVQLFDQSGRVLTFFGSPGKHPGAMYLPAGITIHEADLDLFKDHIHPAFQAERLVLVTNQFGDSKVSVYAMGRLRPGKTVQDIAASSGLVPTGTADETGAPSRFTLPPDAQESPPETPEAHINTVQRLSNSAEDTRGK